MPKSAILKKKLDKGEKMEYEGREDKESSVSSDRHTEENAGKVEIKREEVIDVLRSLEGVKRKLKRVLGI